MRVAVRMLTFVHYLTAAYSCLREQQAEVLAGQIIFTQGEYLTRNIVRMKLVAQQGLDDTAEKFQFDTNS